MSYQEKYHHLLLKLIEGTISERERWVLEKASLDDPFLADAIEGYYESTHDQFNILTSIIKDKKGAKNTTKVRVIKILSIAASLLILIALSFWTINSLQNEADLTAEKEAESLTEIVKKDSAKNDGIINNDSIINEDQVLLFSEGTESNNKPPKSTTTVLKEKKVINSYDQPESINKKIPSTVEALEADQTSLDLREEAEDVMQMSEGAITEINRASEMLDLESIGSRKVSGIVKSSSGMPIVGAVLKSENQSLVTYTDSSGTFNMNVEKEDVIMASYAGHKSKAVRAQDFLEITLAESVEPFTEVNKPLAHFMDLKTLEAHYRKKLNKAFNSYKAKRCSDLRQDLIITIDQDGKLAHVQFSDSMSFECKTELEELIRQWAFDGMFDGNQAVRLNYTVKF